MTKGAERIFIPVEARGVDAVSALWEEPGADAGGSAILLAHGAGTDMDSPWMATVAAGLVTRGFPVLRFNYPYRERAAREQKQRAPDRRPVLEDAHARALAALRARADGRRILLAGKSFGGRISSYLAAKDLPCAGLILLGYPLHPPGKPEKLRHEHFPAIVQPALFLQGTRDALCRLDLMRASLRSFGGAATLAVIDDADHSFRVRKSSGRTDADVLEAMLDRVALWEAETFPD